MKDLSYHKVLDEYPMYMDSSAGLFIPDVHHLPIPFPQDYQNETAYARLDADIQTQGYATTVGHYYARRITEIAKVVFNAEAYCEYLYEDGKHIYRLHAYDYVNQSFLYNQIRNEVEFQAMLRGLIQQLFNYRLNETIKLI